MVEIPKPPQLAGRGGVWFQLGTAQVHLGIETDLQPSKKAHPAFIADGLEALVKEVSKAGHKIDLSQLPLDGYKRAHIFDPFGNRIELLEEQ